MSTSQVHIGIIGTGWGARVQVAAFRAAGMEPVALCGRDPDKTQAICQRLRVPLALTDWQALVARPDLDLVVVSTPPALHREMAMAALAAGKHVLCEKPMARNAAEAKEMAEAAARRPHQIACVDFELRFSPPRQLMRKLVANGYIGRLFHADAAVVNASRADPNRPWDWWSSKADGGGILAAVGSHIVDQLTWLFGSVTAVAARLETFVKFRRDSTGTLRPVDSDDYASVLVRFAERSPTSGSNGLGTILLSAVGRHVERNYLAVYGDEGTLVYNDRRLMGGREAARVRLDGFAPDPLRDLTPHDDVALPASLFDSEWTRATVRLGRALAAAIAAGKAEVPAAATFADGLHNQEVLDTIHRASQTAGWCDVVRSD